MLPPATVWQGTSDDFPAASLPSHSGRLLISQHAGQLLLHQLEPGASQPGPSLIFSMDLPESTDANVIENNGIHMAWAPDDSCVVIWLMIQNYEDDRAEFNENGFFDIVYMLDITSKQLQEICHTSEIATMITPQFAPDGQSLAVPWFSFETNGISVQLFHRSDHSITARGKGSSVANSDAGCMSSKVTNGNAGSEPARAQKEACPWGQVAKITEAPAEGQSMPESISFSTDSRRLAIAHRDHAVVYDLTRSVDEPTTQTPTVEHQGPYSKTQVIWLADDCLMLWYPGEYGAIHCFSGDELQAHISHTSPDGAVLESMHTVTTTASRIVAIDPARSYPLEQPSRTFAGICAHACIMHLPQKMDPGQGLLVSDLPNAHAAPVLSPDGAFLALIANDNKQLCIYDMKDGRRLLQQALPNSLAFMQIARDDVFASSISLVWPPSGQHILISSQLGYRQHLEEQHDYRAEDTNEEELDADCDRSSHQHVIDQLTICKLD